MIFVSVWCPCPKHTQLPQSAIHRYIYICAPKLIRLQRCGWLDLVIVKYSTAVNHYTALNLTKLDILDNFATIEVATAYKVDGQVLDSFPADLNKLSRAEIVYTTLPGWQQPSTGAKAYYDLHKNARAYVEYIEAFVGVKVKYIGTGPAREDMIVRA